MLVLDPSRPTVTATPRRRRRPRIALFLALLVGLTGVADVAAAKPKSGTLRVALPAAGQTDVVLATAAKGATLKVRSAPAGASVAGGVSASGSVVVAVTAKPGRSAKAARRAKKVVITVRGAKPRGVRRIKDVLGRGTLPQSACADVALLGRGLRSAQGAADLARRIADRACAKPTPTPTPKAGVLPSTSSASNTRPFSAVRPSTPARPSAGGGTSPRPGGGSGSNPACANGIDDDGDGQTDGRGASAPNPDPGCTGRDDADETGEVPVSENCKSNAGVFGGPGAANTAAAAINSPCPAVEQAWITLAPGVTTCLATSAANNYGCGTDNGLLHITRQFGLADNQIDLFTINLTGARDCSKTPTIAILSPAGTMHELVEPWPASCDPATEPPKSQCQNGLDDDGDGQKDAPIVGNADPDPGCLDAADNTEGSEIALPDDCTIDVWYTGSQAVFTASSCGTVMGAWFNPVRAPTGCEFRAGQEDLVGCSVIGNTASWGFEPTTEDIHMRAPIAQAPECDTLITVALRREDGATMEGRGPWNC